MPGPCPPETVDFQLFQGIWKKGINALFTVLAGCVSRSREGLQAGPAAGSEDWAPPFLGAPRSWEMGGRPGSLRSVTASSSQSLSTPGLVDKHPLRTCWGQGGRLRWAGTNFTKIFQCNLWHPRLHHQWLGHLAGVRQHCEHMQTLGAWRLVRCKVYTVCTTSESAALFSVLGESEALFQGSGKTRNLSDCPGWSRPACPRNTSWLHASFVVAVLLSTIQLKGWCWGGGLFSCLVWVLLDITKFRAGKDVKDYSMQYRLNILSTAYLSYIPPIKGISLPAPNSL